MKTIAIDPGAGAIKLVSEDGAVDLPSIVAANGAEHVSATLAGLQTSTPPHKVVTPGGTFLVGINAHQWGQPLENLDPDRFTGTPEMEALLCAAMTLLCEQIDETCEEAKVVVGLPLDVLTGEDALSNAQAVKDWVVGDHEWEVDGVPYRTVIKSAKVTSQPSGALFDWLLDHDGHYIPENSVVFSKKEVGIIAIGMNSLELLGTENKVITQRFTVGRSVGVRRMLEIINHDELYSRGEMDAKLRLGDLDYSNALPIWSSEVSDAINKTWTNWKRFSRIIAVGGGAVLLRDMLTRKFKDRLWMPPDPVLSIALGLWKVSQR